MPRNEGGQYRKYDEEDIHRIWYIKVLQAMGFTLNEIADMINNEECDFDTLLAKKCLKWK